MKHPDQLDLFLNAMPATPTHEGQSEESPLATALVVRLPTSRWGPVLWRGKVQHVANCLQRRRSQAEAQAYWNRAISTLEAQLAKAGATPAEIEAELNRFHAAVSDALGRHADPGAA